MPCTMRAEPPGAIYQVIQTRDSSPASFSPVTVHDFASNDFAHIGNWRTFIFGDLVRRYLEFKGYAVQHVMNITDVDDKIIKRVRETGTSLRDFTGQFEVAFFDDLKALNCRLPHQTPRATE